MADNATQMLVGRYEEESSYINIFVIQTNMILDLSIFLCDMNNLAASCRDSFPPFSLAYAARCFHVCYAAEP
jgi:hypothetical protein